jgi:Mrp family chromosome partitioning ATPase
LKFFSKKTTPQRGNGHEYALLKDYPGSSSFAESYRTFRTNVNLSFLDRDYNCLLMTSASQKEGKTTTVANFAYTMAQAGKSVLMVDADLRNPSLSRTFRAKGLSGLTGLIAEDFSTEINQGTLDQVSASDLVRLLAMQRKTGCLFLDGGEEKIELFFHNGRLMDLNWTTRPGNRRLGSVLVDRKILTKEQVGQAFKQQKATGQKLGFVLINSGMLKKDELTGHLAIHMLEGLRTALNQNRGQYTFKELPGGGLEQEAFNPVDFEKIYRQVVIGDERIPFIQARIDASIVETESPGVFLLPSGDIPSNPSELLGSPRMSFLLENLKKKFDRVVFDTPPILPASDALLLAPQVDGVVLVVQAGGLRRNLVTTTVEQLRHAKANIVGVALNQVDTKRDTYYRYYHKYYSKYYGEQGE